MEEGMGPVKKPLKDPPKNSSSARLPSSLGNSPAKSNKKNKVNENNKIA